MDERNDERGSQAEAGDGINQTVRILSKSVNQSTRESESQLESEYYESKRWFE